ncbi:cation channel family protein [Stylonychia lemnae]|uniref:Cation channel family protein n=1 Tax=Stylonychia lemnae TaxID=5949 RepID=A0A078AWD6_STYLE|nr:cation channel family protein [Stylonychia lemnae]|eukprot:CDW86459.1 cation channel family protein [Stylonychia lemnae]
MQSNGKIIERKKDLLSIGESEEINSAAQSKASSIVEIDLAYNQLSNAGGLDVFPNIKILILDHNDFTSIVSLPSLQKLETLSLSYNAIRDQESFLFQVSQKFPSLRHLNVMKNPMNPMFDSEEKYEVFRATVKIWLPSLITLDGTDFASNQDMIKQKQKEIESKKQKVVQQESKKPQKTQLTSIPEEKAARAADKKKAGNGDDLLNDLKKNAAGGKGKGTFEFNQRAYKKYHSSRSLLERILKSHSEGNRFIRNDDL